MHLFNSKGIIQKYHNIEEIFNEFFDIRFKMYVDRKAYILKKLLHELNIIKYKVQFIEEIINDTLDLRKKKKQVVIDELKAKHYPEIAINMKNTPNYDYLLRMDILKLTDEELEELRKKKDMKQAEYDVVDGKTPSEMWIEELNVLEKEYTKNLSIYILEQCNNTTAKVKKTRRKRKTKKKNSKPKLVFKVMK